MRRTFASLDSRRVPLALLALSAAAPAHASLFSGDTLDLVANILAWVVLIVAPVIAITVFWLVHILPERIAEKRHHPQAHAIKTLCLLSLFFGGMLWPLAWLWAYSKPVLYKMAYGVDTVKPEEHDVPPAESPPATAQDSAEDLHPAEDALGATLPARNARALAHERRPWER
jgi:CBS domain containing-hemolysin-like protein